MKKSWTANHIILVNKHVSETANCAHDPKAHDILHYVALLAYLLTHSREENSNQWASVASFVECTWHFLILPVWPWDLSLR